MNEDFGPLSMAIELGSSGLEAGHVVPQARPQRSYFGLILQQPSATRAPRNEHRELIVGIRDGRRDSTSELMDVDGY